MKLFNFATKQAEDIGDDTASDFLFSGQYGFIPEQRYTFTGPEGVKEYTGQEAAGLFSNPEYLLVSSDISKSPEEYEKEAALENRAIPEGLIRGATLETIGRGISKRIGTEEGYTERAGTLKGKISEAIGTAGSLLIPALAGAKAGKIAKILPTVAIDKIGEKVAEKAVTKFGEKTIKKAMVNLGTRAATEASLIQAEKALSDKVHDGKDLFTIDNASKIIKSGIYGGGGGLVLGGVGGAGYKAVKATGEAAVKTLRKFSDTFSPLDASKIPKPDRNAIVFEIDELDPSIGSTSAKFKKINDDTIRYDDGTNVIDLDYNMVKSQVPDFSSADDLNKVGEAINPENPIIGLGHIYNAIDGKKKSWRQFMDDVGFFYAEKPDSLAREAIKNRKAKGKQLSLFKKDDELSGMKPINALDTIFTQRDEIIARMSDPTFVMTKDYKDRIARVIKNMKSLRSSLVNSKQESIKNYIGNLFSKKIKDGERQLYKVLKGYHIGDEFRLFDSSLIDDAINGEFIKVNKRLAKQYPAYVEGFLNHFGARGKTYASDPDVILRMAKYVKEKSGSKAFPSDKELDINLMLDYKRGITMKDAAITMMDNNLNYTQNTTGFTGKNIADWTYENWVKKYVRQSTGEIPVKDRDFVESLKRFIQEHNLPPKDYAYGEIPEVAQRDWTISEINQERIAADQKVKNWLPKDPEGRPTPESDKFLRSYRTFLDNTIREKAAQMPNAEEILKRYNTGNELIQTTEEVRKFFNRAVRNEAAKRKLTGSDLMVSSALAMGGGIASFAMTGSPILGYLIGTSINSGAKFALGRYGDYWSAHLMESIAKNNIDFEKVLSKSIDGFLNKKVVSPVIIAGSSIVADNVYDSYEKEKARLDKFQTNYDQIMNKHRDNNLLLNDKYPNMMAESMAKTKVAFDYLNDKFPKPPPITAGYEWKPSPDLIYSYFRTKMAVENPKDLVRKIESGYLRSEEIDVLKKVYPEVLDRLKTDFYLKIKNKSLTYNQRVLAARLFDYTTENTLRQMKVNSNMQQQQQAMPEKVRQSSGDFSGQEMPESIRIESK